jgi:predicted Holliday junction resolvase-like endonuclease
LFCRPIRPAAPINEKTTFTKKLIVVIISIPDIPFILVFAILASIIVYSLTAFIFGRKLDKVKGELEEFKKHSAATQRGTIRGQILEGLFSLFPQFPYNPSDAHFLGNPIDYVIFNGLTDNRDGTINSQVEVVFVEIKSGKSKQLTNVETLVQQAIKNKRVRWEMVNLDDKI